MEKGFNAKQIAVYRKRVLTVLSEQKFGLLPEDMEVVEKRITNGRRYFFMVGWRHEGRKMVRRFIKIPANDTAKLLLPFRRQIEFAIFFKRRAIIKTRGVVDYNHDPHRGIPFVVMETFPERHARIGFIEDGRGSELLSEREAKSAFRQLMRLHGLDVSALPSGLRKLLKKSDPGYAAFRGEVLKFIGKKILPLDSQGEHESVFRVLERRFKIGGIKKRVKDIFDQAEPLICAKENRQATIVHGDLAPNNLFVFDSGEVEFLDLEWVGFFDNRAIAMIYDFGNLRARAWNNLRFRRALDKEMLSIFRRLGKDELGKIILRLAIIRSHLKLSGYFEDYAWPKQKIGIQKRRRISTENDLKEALGSD